MTVAEALLVYAEEHAPTVADPARIGHAVAALLDFWGERPVSAITKETCRAYGRSRRKPTKRDPETGEVVAWAPCAPGTVRRELGALSAALTYCKGEGRLLNPPKVHLPDKPAPRERWLTRDEAAHLLRAAYRHKETRHLARFILVALYTGTRKSAILGLRFMENTSGGWVNTSTGTMHRRAKGKAETTKRTPPVTLSDGLLAHMRRWERIGVRKDEAAKAEGKITKARWVVEYEGQGVASIKTAWRTLTARVGLEDFHPHDLRHTAITWACQSGRASLWELAGYFGVTVETMIDVYDHHHPDHQQDARRAVGGRKL